MASERTHDITEMTGLEFQQFLTRLASGEDWKGGKLHQFRFKMGKHVVLLFEIKAMKKQNPIEEVLTFQQPKTETFSWEDAREFLSNIDFVPFYYNEYMAKKLHMLGNEVQKMSEFLKICLMMSFEVARCSLPSRDQFEEAIFTALSTEEDDDRREENLTDLHKMFPKKISSKIEDERRQHALYCINR